MNYAFTFDASACTGCKSCQEACKDKNQLPTGILWRRVVEVTGGDWHKEGEAWTNSVFAYNVSLACNHCTHPKCAGVCPTEAYSVRPDGIVLIDPSRCMGCGYCAWACPYGAPQLDAVQGVMTKCNFCYDYVDEGMSPSCVAACPLRILNFGTIEELGSNGQGHNLWQLPAAEHPFPLPDYSRTEPHLVIKSHAGMNSPLSKTVSNQEELYPPHSYEADTRIAGRRELPLVAFTLLTQMAAGMAIWGLVVSPMPAPMLAAIGLLLAAGGLVSFMHLRRKRNAWRSVIHLKKSWLSREILMAGVFGIAWAVAAVSKIYWKIPVNPWPMALTGLGVIYCMGRVYQLRAVSPWNSWRTMADFFLSGLILGALSVNLTAPRPEWLVAAGIGMSAELILVLTKRPAVKTTTGRLRIALLGLGITGSLFIAGLPKVDQAMLAAPIFLIALGAEVFGRWQFYGGRVPFLMQSK